MAGRDPVGREDRALLTEHRDALYIRVLRCAVTVAGDWRLETSQTELMLVVFPVRPVAYQGHSAYGMHL